MRDTDPAAPVLLVEEILRLFQTSWNWAETAPKVVDALGPGLGVDRVYLVAVTEVGGVGLRQTCVTEWRRPPLVARFAEVFPPEARPGPPDDIMLDRFAERRRRGECIEGHTRDLDPYLRRGFEALDICSHLSAPIFVSGRWWGHLGVCDCTAERPEWPGALAATVRIAARLFGDAIEMAASTTADSENTRRAIMNAAADGVVVLDEAGTVVDLNPAAAEIFGEPAGRLLAADFAARVRAADGSALFTRAPEGTVTPTAAAGSRVEGLVRRAIGPPLPVEVTLQEVATADRRLFSANLRDLAPARAAADEIERQRERLHAAETDAALGSLLAGVAHELNNPLAVVVAQTTLLEGKVAGTAFAERVGKIRAAADRCSRIVKGFLAMAKRAPPTRRPVDIDECVRSAVEMMAYGTKSAGIAVETDLCGALDGVPADRDQVTQIVANLILNAQHAMATQVGDRRIRVSTRRGAAMAEIAVEDNGPGVPDGLRERIFEPYFTTKPVGAGTGIGLSVSRKFAIGNGGDLVLAPSAAGARFVLTVPLPEPRSEPEPAPPAAPYVLIVDDEVDVAASLGEILEALGARTRIVRTVPDGLAVARAEEFDLVCADLRMPSGGGLALIAALIDADRAGPFLLVTGDTVSAAAEVAAAGLTDRVTILEKPFTVADVRRAFEAAMGRRD